jgi:sulfite reductase (ferredoxin)
MQILKEFTKIEIDEFKEQIDRFLAGTINEEKFKTIRLNQGIYSQRQPGFYMVRTKLPQGKIFDYQLERIADVAEKYARGLAHLTTRQDIQIHWVELKNVVDILSSYAEAGITTREACGNSVRNITACPLAGVCSKEVFNVSDIAHDTTGHFLRNPLCQNMPRKFKISFSGCSDDCAYSRINDIGFIATESGGRAGFKVYAGGGLGGHPRPAYLLKDFITYDEAVHYADAMVRVFDRYGNRTNRNMARLKYVFEEKGVEAVKEFIEKEYEVVKNIYGKEEPLNIPINSSNENIASEFDDPGVQGFKDVRDPEDKKSRGQAHKGSREQWYKHDVIKQQQEGYYSVIIPLPYGDTNSQQLRDIAKMSRLYGSGEIRSSLDQNLIIPWVSTNSLNNLYNELEQLGFVLSEKTSLNIVSCPGAKTCNIGIARSQGLAQAIHDELNSKLDGDFSDIAIRVCGCPNSCAQHYIGNIGFSGMARRIGERHAPFYQVYLGGNGKENGFKFAKPFLKIPAKHIPALTNKIIELYNSNKQDNELFNNWVTRYGEERLTEELLMYSYLPEYERAPGFYYDYGMDEPFSIKDIGKGECAGGVVDTIEIYLNRAETRIMDADTYARRGLAKQALEQARAAITYAVQALLIIQGEDPDTIGADLSKYVGQLHTRNIIDNTMNQVYTALYAQEQPDDIQKMVGDVRKSIHSIRKITESFDEALLSGKSIQGINKVEVKMANEILDLKGVKCPYNYVKAKLKLEELTSGAELEIYLDDGEPITNVPRSLEDDGNTIVSIDKLDDTHFKLLVKKA